MSKSYQRETNLFEFSGDSEERRVENKKKRRDFAMASLCNDATSLCNGFVPL